GYILKQGGENFVFQEREYVNKNLIFSLPVPESGKLSTYYLRIYSKNYSSFNFRIKSANYFIYYITNEYYFLGLYYGILLIMAVYNLLMFFSIREKVYLYYVMYVASAIIITMTDDGLGFQYLWSNHPGWIRFIGYNFAPLFYIVAFMAYSISFLDMGGQFIKQRKMVLGVTGAYLVYYIAAQFFSFADSPIVYTVPFIAAYAATWNIYLKGYKPAKLFLIGSSLILLSIIILQLRAEHILQGNIFTVYILNIGHLIDVVIFSYALAERFKIIKKEKEEAQREIILNLEENKMLQEKVNRELEQKVRERTEELSQKNSELIGANEQLKILNDKINEMNSRLDYDNWYLKKDIKEEIKARVVDSEVSYEQFNAVFPDETACYRYLEDLKWKDGFVCRKCGNTKFSATANSFTRKCTRCGNVESAMAYTLFHGIKFPIYKAFYITYIVHRKGGSITSEELVQLLNIGRNTAWKFKKKVLEEVENYKKKHKNRPLDSWEEIIF
ncbi:MAG: 7TM diverse intracellular signaling domain-containing protein, partial [Cytophagaceae bacterium]